MKKNKALQTGLALAVMGGVFAPTFAHATEVAPTQSNQTTKVIGTFEATTLEVSIPAVSTFLYNPNTEEMTAQNMNMLSKTNAPVYMTMKGIEVSPESTWIPNLVAPDKYTVEGWKNLTKAETQGNVALGLFANDDADYLTGILNNNLWSTSIGEGQKVGVLKANQSVDVKPTLKAGTAINAQQVLTANYVFEFGLE
jgi:hypothetical protein